MSERIAVNRLMIQNTFGRARPRAIVLPADRWQRLAEEMPDYVDAGFMLASPHEPRLHFLYLRTPIVCGDEEAVEMNGEEKSDTFVRSAQ